MFWQDGVHFVVGKVKGGPHDSCKSTHGSAEKLQEEKILRLFFMMFLIAQSTASTGKPRGKTPFVQILNPPSNNFGCVTSVNAVVH